MRIPSPPKWLLPPRSPFPRPTRGPRASSPQALRPPRQSVRPAGTVETLLLGQNRIAAFPASLIAYRRLRVMDMSSNWLPSLPEDVLWKLTPLQRLILNDN